MTTKKSLVSRIVLTCVVMCLAACLSAANAQQAAPTPQINLMPIPASVTFHPGDRLPVDASFKAIESVVKSGSELLLYSVNSITTGTDAQGEVTVRLSKGGRIVNGQGADTDIVVASARAYIDALNKLQSKLERVNPQV